MDAHDLTLRQALESHLAEEGFGPDRDDAERWVTVRIGPVPLCLPNLPIRRRSTYPHDLNHVVSGYGHDLAGESEISAWELGGGFGRHVAAYFLAWPIVLPAALTMPRRSFAAFVRGRRTRNFFVTDPTPFLDRPVSEVRAALGLDCAHRAKASDVALYGLGLLGAPVAGIVPLVATVVTSPWWISEGAFRRRRQPEVRSPNPGA
ncbi:MAG TPA: hypothetical protein VE991_02735 [Acidimicrobiales bacterium]|nr:hypothetical protein [Acidimicrobiales bacterium]